ncbi:hypothetical protein GCM10019060_24090 [Novosphingobium pokkalii]|nr:hypothetical protein GCM10019060_24090 [Novosphingobium pokkalii]
MIRAIPALFTTLRLSAGPGLAYPLEREVVAGGNPGCDDKPPAVAACRKGAAAASRDTGAGANERPG